MHHSLNYDTPNIRRNLASCLLDRALSIAADPSSVFVQQYITL